MKNWIKDGISLRETRVSFLMLGFVFTLGFALYKYFVTDDITNNLITLLQTFIIAIASYNGIEGASKFMSKMSEVKNGIKGDD